MEPCLIEVHPGASLPSLFFIHKGEEFGYMLAGKLQVQLGNKAVSTVRAGGVIYLKSEVPSQWHNPGSTAARGLWLKNHVIHLASVDSRM